MIQMQEIQRTFILGEEWLYYKIYCGSYSADVVLIESILPIVEELQQRNLIDQWFFLRYHDPKNHLRLRFHLPNVDNLQAIIKLMQTYFCKLIEKDIVYDIVTATYKREIERYGKTTIAEAEKLFYYHSEKTLQLVDNTTPAHDEIARIFASLQMIDELLEEFEISLTHRQEFVHSMQLQFKEEHNVGKDNIKKLDQLYRKYRAEISLFLAEKQEPLYLEGLLEIMKTREEETKIIKIVLSKIKENNTVTSLDLIASLIHMNINRVFRSKQRQYEMLCYDFMNRFYKTILVRK
jgi:thiopeptide-type bacteriocin biosynthesis protein